MIVNCLWRSLQRVRFRSWTICLVPMLLLVGPAGSQESQPAAQLQARIDRLIQQLDDDSFEVRGKAETELAAIGDAAYAKLMAALKDSSPERKQRAEKLVQNIRAGLRFCSTIERADLNSAISAAVSPDGTFLYVAASTGQTASVYRFDAATKSLQHVQSISDPQDMLGVSALRLSPDGRLVVAACGFGMCVVLFERDPDKGTLTTLQVVRTDPAQATVLQRQSDAMFSPDGRFVYSLDRRGAVLAFEVTPERKLRIVQTYMGDGTSLLNASGIAIHPKGSSVFVVGADSSALNVLRRDAKTGKLEPIQVLRDEQDGIRSLERVYGVCTSLDGRFVYTCANRDHSVSAFRLEDDGKLSLLQEFINDKSELKGFVRGNEIVVTPDGLSLFASGSESHSLACFDVDRASGKLRYRATVKNEGTTAHVGDGASGLAVSPDGKFVFVTRAGANAVSVFERSPPKVEGGKGP